MSKPSTPLSPDSPPLPAASLRRTLATMPAALVITSRQNARVRELRSALTDPPRPGSESALGVEGEHLVLEAIRSGLSLRTVFLSASFPAPLPLPRRTETLHLADDVFESISQTRSPQGVAALVDAPRFTLADALRSTPLLVLVEALQDPGNLGTLIRSAEAFGATGVLLLPGCANPFNGKCLRASAGSLFRLPVLPVEPFVLRELTQAGLQLLAATGHATGHHQPSPTAFATADLTRPTALLIGNEGAGLSAALLAAAQSPITIPCTGPVESLNAAVAASVLLFHAQQQRSAVSQS